MMRLAAHCLAGLTLLVFAVPASADWTAKANLGASFATGNSENQSASGAVQVKDSYGKWTHTLGLSGNYGNDGTNTTAQRWELLGQTQYAFTPRAYWFGSGRYEDDHFSSYNYQASLAGGVGYKIIDSKDTRLWVQGGPGYRVAELRDSGGSEDEVIFRGDLGFDRRLTATTKLVERFLVESGSSNTYLQNDLGLEVTISAGLGLRVGYQVRNNSNVLPGVRKTDTLTTIGLLYETK